MRCCTVSELKRKEVICEKNGSRLGYVNDVEIDLQDGRVIALIVWGKSGFGFRSRECDLRICWEDIAVLGKDTILVHTVPPKPPRAPKKNPLEGLFQYG